jgi:NADH dehydrogenase (ubiquinone) Fe-S protein 3
MQAVLLKKVLGFLAHRIKIKNSEIEICSSRMGLLELMQILKQHTAFQYKTVVDIAASDMPSSDLRFNIRYLLLSQKYNSRISVLVRTSESLPVMSVVQLFNGANWLEREV